MLAHLRSALVAAQLVNYWPCVIAFLSAAGGAAIALAATALREAPLPHVIVQTRVEPRPPLMVMLPGGTCDFNLPECVDQAWLQILANVPKADVAPAEPAPDPKPKPAKKRRP